MPYLAGPFLATALLLAAGGAAKAVEPANTVGALRALGLPSRALLVRALGGVEVGVGAAALVFDSRIPAALVAVSYAAFAAFVVVALRRGTMVGSCGCFGKTDTPPTVTHVVLNLAAAGTATAVALQARPAVSLVTTLGRQPLYGLPFLVLTVCCAGLVYLAFTSLAQLSVLRSRA